LNGRGSLTYHSIKFAFVINVSPPRFSVGGIKEKKSALAVVSENANDRF